MKQFKVNGKVVTRLLVGFCISLLIVNALQTYFFSKTLLQTTQKYTELLISEEPDVERSLPHKKLGKVVLTFYCPCEKCVGKKKVVRTATGTIPKAKRTVAVDPKKIPLGSLLYIEGYGYFIAEDTGGAIKGNRIDIFVNSHQEALQLGRRTANAYLLQ